ncbi:MAG: hypothetical protein L6E13_08065 [Firmicutes bacterium]|nr:hypothetical protein [Bacillota bacterium]
MSPWLRLGMFIVGNLIMVPAILALGKVLFPSPGQTRRPNPILATALLLIGLTILIHFGDPKLFSDLRSELGF